ncbi:MAG: host attachment protein [Myxococcales bacterium]|nr:host attachment protein [Myxococcales bacterium]
MSTTWILVAHRAGARVLESHGPAHALTVVRELDHPEGRLKAQEIDADRPGQSHYSSLHGPHPQATEQDATDKVADDFAKELATILDEARIHHRYGRLVLVAAPRFLGKLRDALPHPTASLVVASVDKNIPDAEPATVRTLLENVVLV